MTLRSGSQLLAWLTPLLGCTPLGAWVYTDPDLEVARVRVESDSLVQPPVMVALAVRNPNDYELATARLELQLLLDGIAVGQYDRDSVVPMPQGTVSTMALPLRAVTATASAHMRAVALESGTHDFAVEGRATFTTPFGQRRVRFAHEGSMAFGRPASRATVRVDPGGSW